MRWLVGVSALALVAVSGGCSSDGSATSDPNGDGAAGPDAVNADGDAAGPDAGDAVGGDGGGDGGGCQPRSCEELGYECGVIDDGCGGTKSCGSCEAPNTCGGGGTANVCGCTPDCEGKECGPNGCGGSCGQCPDAAPNCVDGTCEIDCTPQCEDKACGPDGCGGSCGSCEGGEVCDGGECVCEPTDERTCCQEGGAVCKVDSCGNVGETVNSCPSGCEEGQCLDCTPSCEGKGCGPDGCGGSCGTCPGSLSCDGGACVGCGDQTCGSGEDCDSCPEDCGACEDQCGNGSCDEGEGCVSCPEDCGACEGDCCEANGTPGCNDAPCTDAVCEQDPFCCNQQWDVNCATCASGGSYGGGPFGPPVDCSGVEETCGCDGGGDGSCGDGTCGSGEDCASCPSDCGCPSGETCQGGSCEPAETCGDGTCGSGEDCASCPSDCGCPSGETCQSGSCEPAASCGDGTCNGSEDVVSCPGDCGPASGGGEIFACVTSNCSAHWNDCTDSATAPCDGFMRCLKRESSESCGLEGPCCDFLRCAPNDPLAEPPCSGTTKDTCDCQTVDQEACLDGNPVMAEPQGCREVLNAGCAGPVLQSLLSCGVEKGCLSEDHPLIEGLPSCG